MNTNSENAELIFEAEMIDRNIVDLMNSEFPEGEVISSSSFGGTALATLIISASITTIRLLFKFYQVHKESLKNAKIKVGKGQISMEGFSADEISELAKNGTIQSLMNKIK